MHPTRKLSKIGLLVVICAFLVGGSEEAFAKGAVTINNVAKGGAPPKVFIVSENAKGELVKTPVSTEGTRVEIPDGSRIEIMSADPKAMIKVKGDIEVAVQGGSPSLQLSGNTLLNVGAQVEQMHVIVESGNPSVISHGGTTSLSAGQQVVLAIVNNELNVRSIEALPASVGGGLTAGQAAAAIQTPGDAAQTARGAASAAGLVPPQALSPAVQGGTAPVQTVQGLPSGVPGAGQQGSTGSFPGALQGFGGAPQGTGQTAGGPNFGQAPPTGFGFGTGFGTGTTPTGVLAGPAVDPITGLSGADISLLNSLSPTGQTTSRPILVTAPTDPFASLGPAFTTPDTTDYYDTIPTNTTPTYDPYAPTTTSSAETFNAQIDSTATTSTTTTPTCISTASVPC